MSGQSQLCLPWNLGKALEDGCTQEGSNAGVKTSSTNTIESVQVHEEEDSLLLTERNLPDDQSYCKVHSRDKDVLCLTDQAMVCSFCGLFGTHKHHLLKPKTEIINIIASKYSTVHRLKLEKDRISSTEVVHQLQHSFKQKGQEKYHRIAAVLHEQTSLMHATINKVTLQIQQKLLKELQKTIKIDCQKMKSVQVLQQKIDNIDEQFFALTQEHQKDIFSYKIEQISKLINFDPKEGEQILGEVKRKMASFEEQTVERIDKIDLKVGSKFESTLVRHLKLAFQQSKTSHSEEILLSEENQNEFITTDPILDSQLSFLQNRLSDSFSAGLSATFSDSVRLSLAPRLSPKQNISTTTHSNKMQAGLRNSTGNFHQRSRMPSFKKLKENHDPSLKFKSNQTRNSDRENRNFKSPTLRKAKEEKRNLNSILQQFTKSSEGILDLSECQLQDEELYVLMQKQSKEDKAITDLNLKGNKITMQGISKLLKLKCMDELQTLNFSKNGFGENILNIFIKKKEIMCGKKIILKENFIELSRNRRKLEELRKAGIEIIIL